MVEEPAEVVVAVEHDLAVRLAGISFTCERRARVSFEFYPYKEGDRGYERVAGDCLIVTREIEAFYEPGRNVYDYGRIVSEATKGLQDNLQRLRDQSAGIYLGRG